MGINVKTVNKEAVKICVGGGRGSAYWKSFFLLRNTGRCCCHGERCWQWRGDFGAPDASRVQESLGNSKPR